MKVFFILCKLGDKGQRLRCRSMPFLRTHNAGNKMNMTYVWRSTTLTPTFFEPAARRLSSFSAKRSHYQVLGVARNATSKEIREAFLKLSKQCHPDTNTNDPTNHQKFVQVNEAYSILSKPLSRSNYDLTLNADRYVRRQMNATYYRSHGYQYSQHEGAYYHYRNDYQRRYPFEENSWSRDEYQRTHGDNFELFYVWTAGITLATVAAILYYIYNYIPNSRSHFRKLDKDEVEKHELIMVSEDEGITVYYYAVPSKNDPSIYEILAVQRKPGSNSEEHELHEVTRHGVDIDRNNSISGRSAVKK